MINFLKRLYFNIISTFILVVATLTGKIYGPWTKKKTSQSDVLDILRVIQPGDIILTHTRGEFTTLTIPGFWKHCEIYVGDHFCVGAISPKVRMTYIENIIHKTDYFCIVRMKNMIQAEGSKIVKYVESKQGLKYDMRMNFFKPNKMSCSELAFLAINHVRKEYLELRYRLGFATMTPQDFYDAKTKFEIIHEKNVN